MSKRRYISTGTPWEQSAGYSRAIVDGRFVFLAGTTGYDVETGTIPESVEDQARNAFKTIKQVLAECGAEMKDMVRITYYLTDRAHGEKLMGIVPEIYEGAKPTASAIICGLFDPEMKIEIEVTALKPEA